MDCRLIREVHIPGAGEHVRERGRGEMSALRVRMCLRLIAQKVEIDFTEPQSLQVTTLFQKLVLGLLQNTAIL